MKGRTRRTIINVPKESTLDSIADMMISRLAEVDVAVKENIPHEIEKEIRMRYKERLPFNINAFDIGYILKDKYKYGNQLIIDKYTRDHLRVTNIDGEVHNMYKKRIYTKDFDYGTSWNVRTAVSVEYTLRDLRDYMTLDLDPKDDNYSLIREKKRCNIFIDDCILSFTSVTTTKSSRPIRPSLEIEIEFTDTPSVYGFNKCMQAVEEIISKINSLQDRISSWLNQTWTGKFFGSLPVTYRNRNLNDIKEGKYFIQVKLDGERLIVIKHEELIWTLSRSNGFKVEPNIEISKKITSSYCIDTEYAYDSKMDRYRYMAFDMLAHGDYSYFDLDFSKRLEKLKSISRKENISINPTVPIKDMMELTDKIQRDIWLYNDRFITDGIILQHDGPYTIGRDSKVFKWKSPENVTVDYLVKSEGLYLNTEQGLVRFVEEGEDILHWYPDIGYQLEIKGGDLEIDMSNDDTNYYEDIYMDKIVEATYDPKISQWIILAVRMDKSTPNFVTTAMDALESLIENITIDQLFDELKSI